MANATVGASSDWLSNWHTNLVAWWIPQAAVLPGCSCRCQFEPSSGSSRSPGWGRHAFSMQDAAAAPTAATRGLFTSPWSRRCSCLLRASLPSISTDGWHWLSSFSPEARSFGGPPSGRGGNSHRTERYEVVPYGPAGRRSYMRLLGEKALG